MLIHSEKMKELIDVAALRNKLYSIKKLIQGNRQQDCPIWSARFMFEISSLKKHWGGCSA